MCGIAGLLYYGQREGPLDGVRLMADSMRRRGPDDEGFAIFSGSSRVPPQVLAGPDTPESVLRSHYEWCPRGSRSIELPPGKLALGHRRLSILDLSPGGHQPMSTPEGRYWMVYNGEVYNFADLRLELSENGVGFETRSDSEVLLKAWAHWGPGCLEKLNGMFAFAIYDREKRVLFLARDRIGIKPLYWHAGDGFFAFASELPAMIDSRVYRPEVDLEGLYHGMSLLIAPRPGTAFRGVQELEPAHWMAVREDGATSRYRWWSVPTGPADESRSEDSYIEELDTLLQKAVSRCLVSDVEVGTFMSGGVDSTLVSALAAKQQPGIKALTMSNVVDPGLDELPQARATAAMWPMTHIVRENTSDYRIAADPDLTRVYLEPFHSISPNFVIAQLACDSKITVILNGTGPDEIFAGYSRFDSLPRWRRMQWLAPLTRRLPSIGPLRTLRGMGSSETVAGHFLWRFGLFDTYEKQALLTPRSLAQISEPETSRLLESLYVQAARPFADDVQESCFLELTHYVGNHFTNRIDAILMHFSLEGRFPYLDHEVVEFAMRVPSRFKISGRERKRVMRRVASRYIHPSCLSMKKLGFSLPIGVWMQGPLRSLVHDKLTALAEVGEIFRPDVLRAVRDGTAQPALSPRQVWYLVSTQLWLEAFFGVGK